MQKFPMTVEGEAALRSELQQLKSTDRPRVIAAIAEAREHGDLKENAEYHAAREQQGFIEGRIQEIEGKLSNAQVIDIKTIPHTGKVLFGTTVRIINVDTEEEVQYKIVGDDLPRQRSQPCLVGQFLTQSLICKHIHCREHPSERGHID